MVGKGNGNSGTDGVVPFVSQWTDELRKQGIGAVGVTGGHREVVRDAMTAVTLCKLICEPQPRWTPERIEQAMKELFGK